MIKIKQKIMKYIKIERKKIFDCYRYVSQEKSSDFLCTLFWALKAFYHKEVFIRFLDDPKIKDEYAVNYGFMEKSKNMVELYDPFDDLDDDSDEGSVPSAIISIENLKEITRDWKKLYGSKKPVIYLILQDDGWIIVRESLEEEDEA